MILKEAQGFKHSEAIDGQGKKGTFPVSSLPKLFIVTGIFLIALGILVVLLGKISGMGKLPGDILIRKENFTFYFPLTTSLLVSLLLTVLFSVFGKKV